MAIATEVFADENRVIEREMTAEELADIQAIHEEKQAIKAAQDASDAQKIAAKASAIAKLEALGLTEDEAKAIVG